MTPSQITESFHSYGVYSAAMAMHLVHLCADVKRHDLASDETRRVIDIGRDRCVVFDRGSYLAVVFRSTDNGSNWLSNFYVGKSENGLPCLRVAGRMHKGFFLTTQDFLREISIAILEFQARDPGRPRPVFRAGHSRAGPLTSIAAMLLDTAYTQAVYTYGAPRWCDKVMAREYDMRLGRCTFKHVNNNDVVPNLPPWRLGWQHVGRLNYIDRRGEVHRDVHTLPLWDRFMGRVEDFGRPGLDAIKDHSGEDLDAYILPLERAAGVTREEWGT